MVKASASRAEDPGFESRLSQDFFRVESYQWLKNWHSSGYPARCVALKGQCWDWSARCQYAVTGWDGKFGLQFLSQCGCTYNCLRRSVPEILSHVAGTLSKQQTNKIFGHVTVAVWPPLFILPLQDNRLATISLYSTISEQSYCYPLLLSTSRLPSFIYLSPCFLQSYRLRTSIWLPSLFILPLGTTMCLPLSVIYHSEQPYIYHHLSLIYHSEQPCVYHHLFWICHLEQPYIYHHLSLIYHSEQPYIYHHLYLIYHPEEP